jgi:hypothetical protein
MRPWARHLSISAGRIAERGGGVAAQGERPSARRGAREVIAEQEGEEPARAGGAHPRPSRAPRARQAAAPSSSGRSEASTSIARRPCCAPSRCSSSWRTSPSSTTGCDAGAQYEHEGRVPRESLAAASRSCARPASATDELAGGSGASSRPVLTAHPTEATRRTILQAHQRWRPRCAASTTRAAALDRRRVRSRSRRR